LFGIGGTEIRDVINGGKEGTNKFATGDTMGAAEFGGSGAIKDIGYVCSIGGGIGANTKTKEGVIAGDRELVVFFAGERAGGEVEIRRGREFHSLSRDGVVMTKAMEMLDVGRGIRG
jgi:hypothetical protein